MCSERIIESKDENIHLGDFPVLMLKIYQEHVKTHPFEIINFPQTSQFFSMLINGILWAYGVEKNMETELWMKF